MQKILLKNARVVSAEGIDEKDIVISEGKILKVCEVGEGEDLLANIVDEKSEKTFSGGSRSEIAGEQAVGVEGDIHEGLSDWIGKECEIIDCSREGLYVLPGLIDVHVHFREPGMEKAGDFESESLAALAGGVTTIFDMPNTLPPTITCEAFKKKVEIAAVKCKCNFKLFMGAAYLNAEPNLKEIEKVLKDKHLGRFLAGVKVYLGYSTGNFGGGAGSLDAVLKEEKLRFVDGEKTNVRKFLPVVIHAEDQVCLEKFKEKFDPKNPKSHGDARPIECAVLGVKEACHLAKKYNRPIHIVHISSREELDVIGKFRNDKVKIAKKNAKTEKTRKTEKTVPLITCEVSPRHLFLNDGMYKKLGHKLKVNPPVRSLSEVSALWQAVYDREIDIIASDHSPHLLEDKKILAKGRDIKSGMPEVQTTLPLLLNEVANENLSIKDVARLCCEKPAEIFGVGGAVSGGSDWLKVGRIKDGYKADLVIVDLKGKTEIKSKNLLYKCGWSCYEGWKLKGKIVRVFY